MPSLPRGWILQGIAYMVPNASSEDDQPVGRAYRGEKFASGKGRPDLLNALDDELHGSITAKRVATRPPQRNPFCSWQILVRSLLDPGGPSGPEGPGGPPGANHERTMICDAWERLL